MDQEDLCIRIQQSISDGQNSFIYAAYCTVHAACAYIIQHNADCTHGVTLSSS